MNDARRLFREQSYFIVPNFSGEREIAELRRACDIGLDAAREGSMTKGHTTSNIGLLTEAAAYAHQRNALDRLMGFLSSARVCSLLNGLTDRKTSQPPRLKNADYYHEQTKHDWDGDWHRDSQFGRADPDAERNVIVTTTAAHVRIALTHDDRLEIVPGSHSRWDTDDELRIRKGARRTDPEMPGATRVVLRPGDACVFHAWSIHRATYRCVPLRRTLDALYAFDDTHKSALKTG